MLSVPSVTPSATALLIPRNLMVTRISKHIRKGATIDSKIPFIGKAPLTAAAAPGSHLTT